MYIIDLNVNSLLVFVFASTKSQKKMRFCGIAYLADRVFDCERSGCFFTPASLARPAHLPVMEVTESISSLATADSLSFTKVLLN